MALSIDMSTFKNADESKDKGLTLNFLTRHFFARIMNGIIEFNIWTVMKTVVSGKNLTERMGR